MSIEEREEFLTAKQLAAFLQVSESTVRRLAASVAFLQSGSPHESSAFISTPFAKRSTCLAIGSATVNTPSRLTMRSCLSTNSS